MDTLFSIPGITDKQLNKLSELLAFWVKYQAINGDSLSAKEVGEKLRYFSHQRVGILKRQVRLFKDLHPSMKYLFDNHVHNVNEEFGFKQVAFSRHIGTHTIIITKPTKDTKKAFTVTFIDNNTDKELPIKILCMCDQNNMVKIVVENESEAYVASLEFSNNSVPFHSPSFPLQPIDFGEFDEAFDRFLFCIFCSFIDYVELPAPAWLFTFKALMIVIQPVHSLNPVFVYPMVRSGITETFWLLKRNKDQSLEVIQKADLWSFGKSSDIRMDKDNFLRLKYSIPENSLDPDVTFPKFIDNKHRVEALTGFIEEAIIRGYLPRLNVIGEELPSAAALIWTAEKEVKETPKENLSKLYDSIKITESGTPQRKIIHLTNTDTGYQVFIRFTGEKILIYSERHGLPMFYVSYEQFLDGGVIKETDVLKKIIKDFFYSDGSPNGSWLSPMPLDFYGNHSSIKIFSNPTDPNFYMVVTGSILLGHLLEEDTETPGQTCFKFYPSPYGMISEDAQRSWNAKVNTMAARNVLFDQIKMQIKDMITDGRCFKVLSDVDITERGMANTPLTKALHTYTSFSHVSADGSASHWYLVTENEVDQVKHFTLMEDDKTLKIWEGDFITTKADFDPKQLLGQVELSDQINPNSFPRYIRMVQQLANKAKMKSSVMTPKTALQIIKDKMAVREDLKKQMDELQDELAKDAYNLMTVLCPERLDAISSILQSIQTNISAKTLRLSVDEVIQLKATNTRLDEETREALSRVKDELQEMSDCVTEYQNLSRITGFGNVTRDRISNLTRFIKQIETM